jgi:4-hydroxybenzoate polyprenyltransferase
MKDTLSEIFSAIKTLPIGERLHQYALLTRLDRPIGIYLLLWPCLWALWIAAEGVPDLGILLVFVLGTVLMRSAGCAINDYADRDIDGQVARTKNRSLATGTVSSREAVAVFVVLSLLAFLLVLTMNALTIYFSFAALGLAAIYPFSKRFTYLPQVFLGAAYAAAIPMAFAAQTGGTSKITWLLYITVVLWALAYDTMYAMADRDDDIRIGVKSTAILFGDSDIAAVAITQAVVLTSLLLVAGQLNFNGWFYSAWLIACALAVFQLFMLADRQPAHCIMAFLNNHYFGLVIFVGIVLHYATANATSLLNQ